MKLQHLLATGAVALLLAASSPAMAAAISGLSDGDFTTPSGGGSFITYGGGSVMGPWTVTGDSVDLIGGYWQAPSPGGGSVDLDGNAPGGITQRFNLAAENYVLNFSLSGNPDGGLGARLVNVSIGNDPLYSYTVTPANSRSNMDYLNERLAFSTNGGPIDLSFTSQDAGGPYGPVVGAVSISPVPLPAGLPLFGAALMGLAVFGIRKSRKA